MSDTKGLELAMMYRGQVSRRISRSLRCSLLSMTLLGCGSEGSDMEEKACGGRGTICTFMGDGTAALGRDGAKPTDVSLYLPQDIVWGPDKRAYIMDWNNHRIRSIIKGRVETVIGTGELGEAAEGPADEIQLNHPTHVAFAPDGALVLSAWHNSVVMRMAPQSDELVRICGTGDRSFAGEGVDAETAVLDLPVATAFDEEGSMYIMDQGNQRIRKVGADGKIHTVVGPVGSYVPPGFVEVCSDEEPEPGKAANCRFCREGQTDFETCEGPPARPQGFARGDSKGTEAFMNQPFSQSAPPAGGMAMGPGSRLVFVDSGNHLIRALEPSGGVITLAGVEPEPYTPEESAEKTPEGGFSGEDGAPALKSQFHHPRDVAVAADGTIFVADTFNSCVRKITPDAKVFTVAGTCGEEGYSGDGAAADKALLNRPYGVELDDSGNLYIADTYNHRIRVVFGAADPRE